MKISEPGDLGERATFLDGDRERERSEERRQRDGIGVDVCR